MTLIETLVVLLAVLILMVMLFPVISGSRPGRPAKVMLARLQIREIAMSITAYRTDYGRYPVPTNVEMSALAAKTDFTYGGPELNRILGPGAATPVNADVIAILMDLTNYPDGRPTVNSNHNLNPRRIEYLNAKFVLNTSSDGVGTDLVYRDPWGNPYIITMDLNTDGRCRDVFYKIFAVSQKKGATGFDGFINAYTSSGRSDLFEYDSGIMVWSLGPDGKADPTLPSTAPPNSDNVTSWR